MSTTTNCTTQQTRRERGKRLGFLGYSISQSLDISDLYFVHSPKGNLYAVDTLRGSCNCPDFTRRAYDEETPEACKHQIFIECCLRYAARLDREREAKLHKRARRFFSRRHMEALRNSGMAVAA